MGIIKYIYTFLMSMKITFPMFGLGWAGGERIIANLCNQLADKGHNVTIVVPKRSFLGLYKTRFDVVKSMNFRRIPYIEVFTSIASLVPKIPKSDFIFANWFLTAPATLIAAKLFKKGNPAYFVQGYEPYFFPGFPFGYSSYAKHTFRNFENLVTLSSWLSGKVHEDTGKRPPYINPGIDHSLFHPRPKEKRKTKQILCLGRQQKSKGINDIFNAMGIVQKEYKDVELVCVGREKLGIKSSINYRMQPANHKQIAEHFSNADIFVNASYHEGFGQTPLEAMASGTAVVTTDCGGSRDYAENNSNSLVVEPGNPDQMAEAVLKLLTDTEKSEKLISNGLNTAKKFTYEKMADEWEKQLEKWLD